MKPRGRRRSVHRRPAALRLRVRARVLRDSFVRLVIVALVVAAAAVPAHARTVRILMENLVLRPAETRAKVGDTVEWINDDMVAHTATARNGDFDMIVPSKSTVSFALLKAGTIEYYSRFHPIMKGRLRISR
jgi:plastocyanin